MCLIKAFNFLNLESHRVVWVCLIKVDEIINKFHAKWIEVSFTVRIGFFFLKHDCRLHKKHEDFSKSEDWLLSF